MFLRLKKPREHAQPLSKVVQIVVIAREGSPAGGASCILGGKQQGCSLLTSPPMHAEGGFAVMQSPLSQLQSMHGTPHLCFP